MLLYEQVLARAGNDAVECGWAATGFANEDGCAVLHLRNAQGQTRTERGSLLIGADGIHSTVRAAFYPNEGPPIWNGAILWRGVTRQQPVEQSHDASLPTASSPTACRRAG